MKKNLDMTTYIWRPFFASVIGNLVSNLIFPVKELPMDDLGEYWRRIFLFSFVFMLICNYVISIYILWTTVNPASDGAEHREVKKEKTDSGRRIYAAILAYAEFLGIIGGNYFFRSRGIFITESGEYWKEWIAILGLPFLVVTCGAMLYWILHKRRITGQGKEKQAAGLSKMQKNGILLLNIPLALITFSFFFPWIPGLVLTEILAVIMLICFRKRQAA